MSVESIIVDGDIQVDLRRSARARRMVLRVTRAEGRVVLTLPPRVTLAEGRAFAQSRAEWLRQAQAEMPLRAMVQPGALLPVEGRALRLTPAPVRAALIRDDALLLPCAADPGRAAAAFLRHLAHARLLAACDRHAAALGRDFRALTLRDTRSRWGSCTQDGRLMFSWRLAMAPPGVLDYVAAHEVAHLAHMDHSRAFWAACARLMPGFAPHRAWLRTHGQELMAWRFQAD
ncbi:MAG: SprT family zinc-dependent metalloprotease [Paracoccus sp. (in: a-proteobacteria)]|uniref:M48 family metallopeptidase n=1 Tax=Paracoccus sp. TaxID=267 RepID=UPI0039E29B85